MTKSEKYVARDNTSSLDKSNFDLRYDSSIASLPSYFFSIWIYNMIKGIASILNDMGGKSGPDGTSIELQSAVEIGEQKVAHQAYQLLMTELDFDVKSWRVHQRKLKEYDVRLYHQKDRWQIDRHQAAKAGAAKILDKKVCCLNEPVKKYWKIDRLRLVLLCYYW